VRIGENEEEPTPGPVTPPTPGPTQATGLEPVIEGEKTSGITDRDLNMIQDLFQEEIFSMQQELHKQREDFKQLKDLIKSTSVGHDNSIRKMIASFRSEAGSAEVLTIPANRLVNMLEEIYSTVEDPDILDTKLIESTFRKYLLGVQMASRQTQTRSGELRQKLKRSKNSVFSPKCSKTQGMNIFPQALEN
jgi:hypothetical protein